MTLQEVCLDTEARIRRIQEALLARDPEMMDRCESELKEVIDRLEPRGIEMPSEPNESDRMALWQLRKAVVKLGAQVALASNLCQGWAQLRLSMGYTAQGKPALAIEGSKASFEV